MKIWEEKWNEIWQIPQGITYNPATTTLINRIDCLEPLTKENDKPIPTIYTGIYSLFTIKNLERSRYDHIRKSTDHTRKCLFLESAGKKDFTSKYHLYIQ